MQAQLQQINRNYLWKWSSTPWGLQFIAAENPEKKYSILIQTKCLSVFHIQFVHITDHMEEKLKTWKVRIENNATIELIQFRTSNRRFSLIFLFIFHRRMICKDIWTHIHYDSDKNSEINLLSLLVNQQNIKLQGYSGAQKYSVTSRYFCLKLTTNLILEPKLAQLFNLNFNLKREGKEIFL